jgi:ribosomal protein S26
MGRGRERLVNCAQCGRQVRRDKAVTIEKAVFTNPLNRDEVHDEQYTRMFTREFSYCPSCGKHFRIYQQKKRQQERERERERSRQIFNRRPERPREKQGEQPATPAAPIASKPIQETNAEQGETTNRDDRIQTQAGEKEPEASEAMDEEQQEALKE